MRQNRGIFLTRPPGCIFFGQELNLQEHLRQNFCEVTNMVCRGIRGATTADANTRDDILRATRELLALMIRQNGIQAEDVGSVIFSTTPDLYAEFPALAARQLGWYDVALLCNHELDVPGSLRRASACSSIGTPSGRKAKSGTSILRMRPICVPTAHNCRRWMGKPRGLDCPTAGRHEIRPEMKET